jgi:hypothetical protein
MRRVVALLLLVAGCRSNNNLDSCSQLQSCPAARGYQFCSTGSVGGCGVGRYVLSDGTSLMCNDCASCQVAAVQVAAWCSGGPLPSTDLGTPSASTDLAGAMAASVTPTIPKTGAPYTGPQADPLLGDATQCPDANLEPNDGPAPDGHPLAFTPTPDQPTPKIVKLAICPTGNSPHTGKHDVDWFVVDNTTGPSSLTLMAEIFYDITYGDLDVAILDSALHVLAVDGSAQTNGCAAALISQGRYYVVVAGANGVDSNRYEALIRTFSTAKSCP